MQAVYGDGFVFNQLKHLKLCVCQEHSLNVLVRLLKDSPNLRLLDLFEMEVSFFDKLLFFWLLKTMILNLILLLDLRIVTIMVWFAGINQVLFLNVCCRVYKLSGGRDT